jgi:hypothetical protein
MLRELRLNLQLLQEILLGDGSTFAPYIRVLPSHEDFASLPGAAEEKDLERFRTLPVAKNALANRAVRKRLYTHLRECVRPTRGQEFTFELFTHIQNLVDTRYYNANCKRPTWLGKTREWCSIMVPLSDMANYEMKQENLEWPIIGSKKTLRFPNGHWELKAAKNVARGQQYIELYKESSNELILENWGFWLPGNAYRVSQMKEKDCGQLYDLTQEHLTQEGECRVAMGINCSLARLSWEHCRKVWDPDRRGWFDAKLFE